MDYTYGTQTVKRIPERNIVLSKCVGTTNVDELKWLVDKIVETIAEFNSADWAYIADCSEMTPVTPDEGDELVRLTKALVDNGCVAITFVDSPLVTLKLQSQNHTERSATGVLEAHFTTTEEALSFLDEALNI